MEKIIWVLGNDKKNMYNVQRRINSTGSMKVCCILTYEALEKVINDVIRQEYKNAPALIVINWQMLVLSDFKYYARIKEEGYISGVPMFFMGDEKDMEEECYKLGGVGIISNEISGIDIRRLETMAWQFETAKSMEHKIEKQSNELLMAREIMQLNKQLADRNELLYKVFGRYFSDDVMKSIFDSSQLPSIGGEKMEMTVMMSDLRGFTALSQKMDSDVMMNVLNFYFAKMVDIINYYKGTVIEFLGDGILTVFGAPLYSEYHTDNAVAAAINMQNAMAQVDQYCIEKGYPRLNMGIGIHCGPVFIGNIGSEKLMRYNVIGNVVNECSRIESYSVGGQIYISDVALNNLKSEYETKGKKEIIVKGIEKPLIIWEVCEIKGTYECKLIEKGEDQLINISSGIKFFMFTIHNKMIDAHPVSGVVKKMSQQRSVLELEENTLQYLDDVKIRAIDKGGNTIFDNIYGKVTKVENGSCVINFTYVSEEIQRIINEEVAKMKIVNNEFAIDCSGNYYHPEQYKYYLSVHNKYDEVTITVSSKSKEVRAIEVLDYIVPEFALVKGDAKKAEAIISQTVLNALMHDECTDTIEMFFEKKIRDYYGKCCWLYSSSYAKANEEEILKLPRYKKRQQGWAYVRTTDLGKVGESICLKSLENESGETVILSDDVYIMIGCRGEIYTISREKFESTYTPTEEALDVFEQMLELLPEVVRCSDGEYMSIDEQARICYPKQNEGIYVKPLEVRTKVFGKDRGEEYFLGRPGDYLAIRCDDIEDMYVIQEDVFGKSYESA